MPYVVESVTKISARYVTKSVGEYADLKKAIDAAMREVDNILSRQHTRGMTAEKLFEKYKRSGQGLYIFGAPGTTTQISGFNHFQYAMRRCKEIARS